jgi:hypothetical protein
MALTLKKKIEITLVSMFLHAEGKDASADTAMQILNLADCSLDEFEEYGNLKDEELDELHETIISVRDISKKLKDKFQK